MKTRFLPSGFLQILAAVTLCQSIATGQTLPDSALTKIQFDQKPGGQISLSLPFRDESGNSVSLGQFFGQRPVVLILGYYRCPMLCTLVLNGMVESASDMKWSIGPDFSVVDVSIDPNETPSLAAAKKRTYVRRYGRDGSEAGWHFLTGPEASIHALADQVGFRYSYDPASRMYAHPSGLVIVTPQGKISHYLFGVAFNSRDFYEALRDASGNNVATGPIHQLILLCFRYNPLTGKYSATIMGLVRLLGALTFLGLTALIIVLAVRRRSRPGEFRPALADKPNLSGAP